MLAAASCTTASVDADTPIVIPFAGNVFVTSSSGDTVKDGAATIDTCNGKKTKVKVKSCTEEQYDAGVITIDKPGYVWKRRGRVLPAAQLRFLRHEDRVRQHIFQRARR